MPGVLGSSQVDVRRFWETLWLSIRDSRARVGFGVGKGSCECLLHISKGYLCTDSVHTVNTFTHGRRETVVPLYVEEELKLLKFIGVESHAACELIVVPTVGSM